MDPGKIFQIITNSTLLATRLLSGGGGATPLEFTQPRYCALLSEDAKITASVLTVSATHKHGSSVRYSITGGNRDGLFSIDERTGVLTVAAALDYEIRDKHEVVVAAESGDDITHTVVQVRVADINDNAPDFISPNPIVTVIEEDDRDLPAVIAKVEAYDEDWLDQHSLLYTVTGDGVDGFTTTDAFFTVHPRTGDLIQLRALDRDPPTGKAVWKVRVQVRDGQTVRSGSIRGVRYSHPVLRHPRVTDSRWGHLGRNQKVLEHFPRFSRGAWSRQRRSQHHPQLLPRQPLDKVPAKKEEKKVFTRDRYSEHDRHFQGYGKDHRRVDVGKAKKSLKSSRDSEILEENGPISDASNSMWQEEREIKLGNKMISLEDKVIGSGKTYKNEFDVSEIDAYTNRNSDITSHKILITDSPRSAPLGKDLPIDDSQFFMFNLTNKYANGNPPPHSSRRTSRVISTTAKAFDTSSTRKGESLHHRKRNQLTKPKSRIRYSYPVRRGSKFPSKYRDKTSKTSSPRPWRFVFSMPITSRKPRSVQDSFSSSSSSSSSSSEMVASSKAEYVREIRHDRSRKEALQSSAESLHETLKVKSVTETPIGISDDVYENNIGRLTNADLRTMAASLENQPLSKPSDKRDKRITRSSGRGGLRRDFRIFSDLHRLRRTTRSPRAPTFDRQGFSKLMPEIEECDDFDFFSSYNTKEPESNNITRPTDRSWFEIGEGGTSTDGISKLSRSGVSQFGRGGRVHVVETIVTVVVKDINDNAPTFPNATMFGEVQENGPIDLSVAVISAWDADDATEGTNARLTYSIEKNVIDERSGDAIFNVHPDTGLITTSLCCLDRETTPLYHIQVVAADGGGLKGTGTVVVRLSDVNDNSPRLARQHWDLVVDETWGDRPPENTTLLEISAADHDTNNYFFYRVVEASGWGWQHFDVRSVGAVGQLFPIKTIDYENETHRQGFKFMVQVTDRGRGGWRDPRHVDTAWVSVRIRDVNDNPPLFDRSHAHLTVREDAASGTHLVTLPAKDPDMGGRQGVSYSVQGGWGALSVDTGGGVSLVGALDREGPQGATGVAKVIAVDDGHPRLTATATLTITVTDVNDCPPSLLPPTTLHVTEDSPPSLLGILTATDHDVWALGHGPPFKIALDPSNPPHVLSLISLKFDPHLDSGRGGAEVWTVGGVDREEHRELKVGVRIEDAGELSDTHTLTIIIDDLNDNPMKPAAKTVYLWKTRGGGSDAPLGRVYVADPDDWDIGDKSFSWHGPPHPLFSLNPDDGSIFASSQVREGSYNLGFEVSDRVWDQKGVRANVTVIVRVLAPETLSHAAPITLAPSTPALLTQGWTPTRGGGKLGKLVQAVQDVVGGNSRSVEVVSVYGHPENKSHPSEHPLHSTSTYFETSSHSSTLTSYTQPQPSSTDSNLPTIPPFPYPSSASLPPPSSCVWVSVKEGRGRFMDPVKLHGLLGLHTKELELATNLTVVVNDPAMGPPELVTSDTHLAPPDLLHPDLTPPDLVNHDPASAASRASTGLPLQVVDTNVTSLVTPRLTRALTCPAHAHEPETCTPLSCLNGGRCVRSHTGNRCVCPGGFSGPRCKVPARTFFGRGWAWVNPLPPCLPATFSLRVLTRHTHALLVYSGPLAPPPVRPPPTPSPMLALQVVQGRPQVLLEGGESPLKLETDTFVSDGNWHTLHLHLNHKGVALMVDLCGRGWEDENGNVRETDSHCVSRAKWSVPRGLAAWAWSGPLQVGGLAHAPPRPEDHSWRETPTHIPLRGCISHLTVNTQLVDLGEPAYSKGSESGCKPQDVACVGGLGGCGLRGACVGGLERPQCECEPGWAGSQCATPTTPAYLGTSSYMKVALSFTPAWREVSVQLRLRTRGSRNGLLLHLAAHHRAASFSIQLRSSVACASLTGGGGWVTRTVCVEGRPLGDGSWHTVRAERHGHNLIVTVDDGDGWRRNESLVSLDTTPEIDERVRGSPMQLEVDKHDGVTVGGLPEFLGVTLVAVHDDLNETCVDDLRVSGRPLPIPPAVNGTTWGQVTTLEHMDRGCTAPDACLNTTCAQPLHCTTSWGHATCSCGPGRQLTGRVCEDVDECVWQPCLHGGSCHNLRPGFLCTCDSGHTGDYCQWNKLPSAAHPLTAPAAIAALTISLLLLIVFCVVLSFRIHRQRVAGLALRTNTGVDGEEGTIVEVKAAKDKGGGGGGGRRRKKKKEGGNRETFFDCIKFKVQHSHPALSDKGEKSPSSTCATSVVGIVSGVTVKGKVDPPEPLLPRDDLRAYAYEGDGSSSGSYTSTISGLRVEMTEDGDIRPLVPEFLEVMDLLKNLPEASKSSLSITRVDETSPDGTQRDSDTKWDNSRSDGNKSMLPIISQCSGGSPISSISTSGSDRPIPCIFKSGGGSPLSKSGGGKNVSCVSKSGSDKKLTGILKSTGGERTLTSILKPGGGNGNKKSGEMREKPLTSILKSGGEGTLPRVTTRSSPDTSSLKRRHLQRKSPPSCEGCRKESEVSTVC